MTAAIAQLLSLLIGLYGVCVIAWIILTTLLAFNMVNRSQRAVMLSMYALNRLCGPALRRLRRWMPGTGRLDLAPVALLLLLDFAQNLVMTLALGQNPLFAVIGFIATLIQLFIYCLIAQIVLSLLLSFGIVNRYQPFVAALAEALDRLCEPALAPIRRLIPPLPVFDISPLLLLLALGLVRNALLNTLYGL